MAPSILPTDTEHAISAADAITLPLRETGIHVASDPPDSPAATPWALWAWWRFRPRATSGTGCTRAATSYRIAPVMRGAALIGSSGVASTSPMPLGSDRPSRGFRIVTLAVSQSALGPVTT